MGKIHIYTDGSIFYATDENTTASKGTEAPVMSVDDTEENLVKYLTAEQRNIVNELNNMIQSNQR